MEMKIVPNPPRDSEAAAWTQGIPLSSSLGATPEQRSMKAVAEQIRMVSMNTESICTSPCFTGWETEALAAAFGADPTPASLENSPLLIPFMTQEPANPPKIARKSKAFVKISRNICGISS